MSPNVEHLLIELEQRCPDIKLERVSTRRAHVLLLDLELE
jgi:hypothetical protein